MTAAPAVDAQPAKGADDSSAMPVVPFVRASDENLQPGNVDVSRLLTAGAQDLGVFDVTAYGYIRFLHILIEGTAGAGAGAVGAEDAPWNVLQNIALTEPNGAYIAQFTSGYEMFLANKFGGRFPPYAADPRRSILFSAIAGTGGNFTAYMIVPVDISGRDGVGALPNQDSAGQFKFRATLAPSTTVFTTPPATTLPTIRVRAWLAAWDQPEPNSGGLVNETEPPGMGTTSFWSVQSGITVNAGDNTIDLKRKGNYLRQIVFILRRAGTSRSNGESDWPTETRFLRDAFPARYYNNLIWRQIMQQVTGFGGLLNTENLANDTGGGMEAGVRFHDYMHEFNGTLGWENRDLWQPTRGSTSLQIAGNFANAGTLTVIYNDVAIAEDVFL